MSALLRAAVTAALPLCALVLAAPASASDCTGADAAGGAPATRVSALRCLVADARAASGRPPLHPAVALRRSAAAKAGRIDACDAFSHTPCGNAMSAPMRRSGYARGCFTVGENLLWVTPGSTPREVLDAWLESPAHRDNLLSADYRDTGVARRSATLPDAGRVELWVQHFGARC